MPDIRPFSAWRYNLGRVGALSDVTAPPYDVIGPAFQSALYDKHPNNVVRLILNREEPGDNEQQNRYTRAARFLKDWQREGVLVQESDPALYVYHQLWASGGCKAPDTSSQSITRRGLLTRVRLEKFGEGKIYAHEETMPGPKADRLKLMHATQMNLSPIFGLYPDPSREIQSLLDDAVRNVLPIEAADHLGTASRFWPVMNSSLIRDAQRLLFDKPVFIADGHHRYETAIRYRDDLGERGVSTDDPESPPNFVLMMLVGMSDSGLQIMPTHRLVSGCKGLQANALANVLQNHFDLEVIGAGAPSAEKAWEMIETAGDQSLLGFGTVADNTWQVARFRSPEAMTQLVPDRSPAWRGLAVSVLHVLVLNELIKTTQGHTPTCRYVHLLDEVTTAMAKPECDLAVLVPPATMEHVEQIAGNLEKMPPKSTYFYPKLMSGLVFNPLGHA